MALTPLFRQDDAFALQAPCELERAPVAERRTQAYYIETLDDSEGFFTVDAAGRLTVTAAGTAAGFGA
jgi:hypothetical protein